MQPQNTKEITCHKETARSIGCRSDMYTTHNSIDQNDHSYIIQF